MGDELLSIDGTSAADLVEAYGKYLGQPNALAARHFAANRLTSRPVYLSRGIQANQMAKLRLRDAAGAEREATAVWSEVPRLLPTLPTAPAAGTSSPRTLTAMSNETAEVITAELSKRGAREAFFMTDAVKASLGIAGETSPSDAALAKFGLSPEDGAAIHFFATTYQLDTKKVLFVRLPDYAQDPLRSPHAR